ncbi:MAG: hypothetical protein VB042_02930 [Victivallaceae bacterium]|nr:hypothetical protein [Victivallaceae bacterium]
MKSPIEIEVEVVWVREEDVSPENMARIRKSSVKLQETVGRILYARGQRMLANGEFK